MQNFSLLKRAGRAKKPVLLKRGMAATLDEFLMAAEYILSEGNYNVMLCERGVRTFSDFSRNTLDLAVVPAVKKRSHLPIFVDPSGQNRIIVVKGANDALGRADVDAAAPVLEQAACIVLQFEIPLETVAHTVAFARRRGIRTIVNPAPALPVDLATLEGVDYFVPNQTEAGMLTGLPVGTRPEIDACAKTLVDRGLRNVIVTLGEQGAWLANAEGSEAIAGVRVAAIDTTGAGDAFIGSFAAFLTEGLDARAALERANLYAALSTTKVGTQKSFMTRDEFERAIANR
jgi:ribokinase